MTASSKEWHLWEPSWEIVPKSKLAVSKSVSTAAWILVCDEASDLGEVLANFTDKSKIHHVANERDVSLIPFERWADPAITGVHIVIPTWETDREITSDDATNWWMWCKLDTVVPLLQQVVSLAKTNALMGQTCLYAVTQRLFSVGGTAVYASSAPLLGLLRNVKAEHDLPIKVIDFSDGVPAEAVVPALFKFINDTIPGGLYALRSGKWYKQLLSEKNLIRFAPSNSQPKSYLIFGGVGAISLELAKYLAARSHRITLVGRRLESSPEVSSALKNVNGSSISYIAADVSRYEDVRQFFDGSHQRYDGIVHSAGFLKDGLLANLSEDMAYVGNAKVAGTLNLLKCIKTYDTGVPVLLLSSVASVLGFLGQTNFVIATTMMDTLAAQSATTAPLVKSLQLGPVNLGHNVGGNASLSTVDAFEYIYQALCRPSDFQYCTMVASLSPDSPPLEMVSQPERTPKLTAPKIATNMSSSDILKVLTESAVELFDNKKEISSTDSLVNLGFDFESNRSVSLRQKILEEFNVTMELREIPAMSLLEMSYYIYGARKQLSTGQKNEIGDYQVNDFTKDEIRLNWCKPLGLTDGTWVAYPTTSLQSGFVSSSLQSAGAYVEQTVLALTGISYPKLEIALKRAIQHHEILRTCFVSSSNYGVCQIIRDKNDVHVELEYSDMPLDSFLRHDKERGFSFESHLWLRMTIVTNDGCDYSVLSLHHALHDGFCLPTISHDIFRAYQDEPLSAGLPFRNMINYVFSRDQEADRQFWKHYLEGFRPKLTFGGLDQRLGSNLDPLEINSTISLVKCSKACGVTQATIIKTAWVLTLCKVKKHHDISYGLVTSCRDIPLKDIDKIVGPVLNTIPCRILVDSTASCATLAKQIQDDYAAILPHMTSGLNQINRWSSTSPSLSPLFDSNIVIENAFFESDANFPGVKVHKKQAFERQASFPLELVLYPTTEGWAISLFYNDLAVTSTQARAILEEFHYTISALANQTHTLVSDLLEPSSKHRGIFGDLGQIENQTFSEPSTHQNHPLWSKYVGHMHQRSLLMLPVPTEELETSASNYLALTKVWNFGKLNHVASLFGTTSSTLQKIAWGMTLQTYTSSAFVAFGSITNSK
ncbi:hypothetical protein HDV05_006009 [Chytridiales sp. JEL 0842]|nr:hypothetical protein HDV05_006009 [Chytridiales sp. JEL 0842]